MYLDWMAITCAYLELKTTKQLIAHRQYRVKITQNSLLAASTNTDDCSDGFPRKQTTLLMRVIGRPLFLTVALIGCSHRRRKASWPILSKTSQRQFSWNCKSLLILYTDLTRLLYVLFCSLCCPNERSSRSGASMLDTFSIWLRFETAFNLFDFKLTL